MTRLLGRLAPLFLLAAVAALPAFAETSGSGLDFGMGLGIGVATYADGTWQSLSLTPDLAIGKFGIGLDVKLNYRFGDGMGGTDFEVRAADWVPNDFQDFLKIYLPKIAYVRWDEKGAPLYVKFGSIEDGTLGNGFIMGDYANDLFLPDNRHFGLAFDLDGALFKFPFLGFESFVGDLAELDVFGGRLFVRPLAWLNIPIIKNLQIGATAAMDVKPYLYDHPADLTSRSVAVYGADIRLPIIATSMVSLISFADVATIDWNTYGGMLGVGGRLFGFLTYGAQLRALQDGFIPTYFDAAYDIMRGAKYDLVQAGGSGELGMGWYASLGTSFLKDKIVFNVALDAPFQFGPDTSDVAQWPHLRGVFVVGQIDALKGFSFDASYDKSLITSFASLIDPTAAAIQARLNYQAGPAVLSFVYKLRYDATATPDPWVITSGLESTIALF
jgi:hypothetical protein